MFRDVEDYVASCKKCQQRKHPKKPAHPPSTSHVPSDGPWREIAFDAVGPFPETDDGNKHILVFMDHFTKSCELFPVKDLKETTVAQIIVNEIVPRHGCPATILTDRAASFNSELLQQIYALLNTKKLNTSAYNPQPNGQVERFNETLVVMISMYVSKHQSDWDKHLNILRGAYMSAPHPTTGYTPNYMEYGRELKLPLDTVVSAKEFYVDREDFLSKLLQRTSFAQDLARARLLNRKIELEEKQEQSNVQLEYKFGDKVLVFVPDSKTRLSNKFRSRWLGPFTVIERTSPVNYRVVRHLPGDISDTRMVNVRRMKPFREGSELSKAAHALEVPLNAPSGMEEDEDFSEDGEFEVETILDKKLLYRKPHFLVKWRGYGNEFNSWEPLENLCNSSVLVEEFEQRSRRIKGAGGSSRSLRPRRV
jgi:transposase InsO family protein